MAGACGWRHCIQPGRLDLDEILKLFGVLVNAHAVCPRPSGFGVVKLHLYRKSSVNCRRCKLMQVAGTINWAEWDRSHSMFGTWVWAYQLVQGGPLTIQKLVITNLIGVNYQLLGLVTQLIAAGGSLCGGYHVLANESYPLDTGVETWRLQLRGHCMVVSLRRRQIGPWLRLWIGQH